jgi:D-alanine-D-alanine ligase
VFGTHEYDDTLPSLNLALEPVEDLIVRFGVAKVMGYSQMKDAVEQAGRLDADILCEQCIIGDEVTCPVIGSGEDARALPVIRIQAPDGNYDYEHKYFSNDTQYLVPCGLPAGEEEAIQRLVLKAYRVLGCRGWGRADLMQRHSDGKIFLLEMNTSPGMTSRSVASTTCLPSADTRPGAVMSMIRSASTRMSAGSKR